MCSLVGKQLAKRSLQVSTGRCTGVNGCLALAGSSETDFQGVKLSTFHPKSGDITRKWYVIDATDVVRTTSVASMTYHLRVMSPLFGWKVDNLTP